VANHKIEFLQNQNNLIGKPSILVVTPVQELGEIISESLKEAAWVEHLASASKAISFLRRNETCKQVILDMEMGGLNLLNLGRALRLINESIKILIISKAEAPTDLDEIQPWEFLRKPLLLRDLQTALGIEVSEEYNSSNIIDLESAAYEDRTPSQWTKNPALATQYLARLIEKSFAQEALLIQNQELWSYAGRLPEESVREVGRVVTKSSAGGTATDFMRFVKLETSQSEHALYASLIAIGVILALVFDPDIPLGIIRKQTHKLADTLMLLDGADGHIYALSTGDDDNKPDSLLKTASTSRENFSSVMKEYEAPETGSIGDSENKNMKFRQINHFAHEMIDQGPELDAVNVIRIPTSTAEPVGLIHYNRTSTEETIGDSPLPVINQSTSLLEMMSDSLYNLQYSCLLIPRFPSHRLTTHKTEMIEECVKNTNISYGWRLEAVEANQDFLRLTTSLPPFIAPTKYLNIIRKVTSKKIFDDFPAYKDENPSGDYWAPGFIIIGGKNTISDSLVSTFTKQNREKYGLKME
jgi:putative transposase